MKVITLDPKLLKKIRQTVEHDQRHGIAPMMGVWGQGQDRHQLSV
jgi:hypothetical protein